MNQSQKVKRRVFLAALALLFIVLLSLTVAIVVILILPSEVSLNGRMYGFAITLTGGAGIFYLFFRVFKNAFVEFITLFGKLLPVIVFAPLLFGLGGMYFLIENSSAPALASSREHLKTFREEEKARKAALIALESCNIEDVQKALEVLDYHNYREFPDKRLNLRILLIEEDDPWRVQKALDILKTSEGSYDPFAPTPTPQPR